MPISAKDTFAIRQTLREIKDAAAHKAADPPDLETLYTPETHEKALDPDRALVVGNRGVGKSLWASVLADPRARLRATVDYPRLGLSKADVVLGFHEAAGKTDDPAPSPERLRLLLAGGFDPEAIWRGVLLQALGSRTGLILPDSLSEVLTWVHNNLDAAEAGLRKADADLRVAGRRFVLLFDALDRLGGDWTTIRRLSEGLLRFALDLRGYKAIRVKLFMRTDQARDDRLFQFPDASKLRAERVELLWRQVDLYGLLYGHLWHSASAGESFRRLVTQATRGAVRGGPGEPLPRALATDEKVQAAVIGAISSPYMGSNSRQGWTYSWLHTHLADAFLETNPRSFLIALRKAAQQVKDDVSNVLDHHAIRDGVREASSVRVDQLKEDYPWILAVLSPLAELEVPCPRSKFIECWRNAGTIATLEGLTQNQHQLGPVELADHPPKPAEALLSALQNIGVVEQRKDGKINVPDIFRVAARLKRRGGMRPPSKR